MFVIIILFVIVLLYFYGTRTFNYWTKRGVKHDQPLPFVGNSWKQFLQQASICMMATEAYNKYPKERVVGFYRGTGPELVIRDPVIAKTILFNDFKHFHARGVLPHKSNLEPLFKNLFFADGDMWKLLRQRFTPTFSTGKLKAMFPIIMERAEKLQLLTEELTKKEFYDAKELMARYTTDFIGACGFGINMDSMSDENSQFRWLGNRIFHRTKKDGMRGALKYIFPEMCKDVHFLAPEIETSMNHLVKTVMNERNYKPIGKNDFIDLLLELRENGKIVGESIEHTDADGKPKTAELEMSDMIMIAQVFIFFGAGFETSSTASSYTLHQLAFNPDCQEKVQQELDRVLPKHGNKLTYDAINEMHYLEMVFYESLRMYPPVGYLIRKCTSPKYTFPNIDLSIDEGVTVVVPIQAMHRDPQYFEHPDKFDPERFRDGTRDMKNFFMPFGDGPRACVGARLGQIQAMAGIAAVLQKFSVEPAACSVKDPIPDPTGTVSEGFVGGLPLKFRKRVK